MSADQWVYPFGVAVLPRPPSASGQRRVFVLGAYPSALHVAWVPPRGLGRPVKALPVADEPMPFWDGADANHLFEQWRHDAAFTSSWGGVSLPQSNFNGGSGRPIEPRYLAPLGLTRADAWITDCLDTHRASKDVTAAIASVYAPLARELGMPRAALGPHPEELDVVGEATREHSDRLVRELDACAPDVIITLGNAALTVLWSLPNVAPMRGDAPTALTPRDYGRPCDVRVGRRRATLWALGHPNVLRTIGAYGAVHALWMEQPTVGARVGRS